MGRESPRLYGSEKLEMMEVLVMKEATRRWSLVEMAGNTEADDMLLFRSLSSVALVGDTKDELVT
ncbi:hypothetical protein HPP92_019533 [Vanilla planifolia]|uniref:Uncharacterized protein n=1 Tax=Vanilla planifolia TaxID=51239 RepID=A0A835UJE7_VANPL|nr:hypothetical protein HPP92_019533 [Vanilla planifolia]